MPTRHIEVTAGISWKASNGASGAKTAMAARIARPTAHAPIDPISPRRMCLPTAMPVATARDHHRPDADGHLPAAKQDHDQVVRQGKHHEQQRPHPGEPNHRAQAEQCDAGADHEHPHRHQIEPQQIEIQVIALQQHPSSSSASTSPIVPTMTSVCRSWMGSSVRLRRATPMRRENGGHRNHPHVAAQAAAAGGLDDAAQRTLECQHGEDRDVAPAQDQPVDRVQPVQPWLPLDDRR